MSELRRPRRARANAFDLDRVDRDDVEVTTPAPPLGDLLPKVAPQVVPTTKSPRVASPAKPEPATEVATPRPVGERPVGERPRGSGGRPSATDSPSRITATAARIPVELYDRAEVLVKGRGRPSWGQLIAWTCQTRSDEVVAEVLVLLRPVEGVLVPRGQNKRGVGATQITARFTAPEHSAFEHTRAQAQRAAQGSPDLPDEVTATAVVSAALAVAARHGEASAQA
jgi:hypothetical protein